MSLHHHEHPAFRSFLTFAEGYRLSKAPRLEPSTVGSLGHCLVQPRRETPTAIRRRQDADQSGGREPGSLREFLVEI